MAVLLNDLLGPGQVHRCSAGPKAGAMVRQIGLDTIEVVGVMSRVRKMRQLVGF